MEQICRQRHECVYSYMIIYYVGIYICMHILSDFLAIFIRCISPNSNNKWRSFFLVYKSCKGNEGTNKHHNFQSEGIQITIKNVLFKNRNLFECPYHIFHDLFFLR